MQSEAVGHKGVGAQGYEGKDLRKQQKQQLRQCLLDTIVDLVQIVDAPPLRAAHLERPAPEHSQILQVATGWNKSTRPCMPAGRHRCPAGRPNEPGIAPRAGRCGLSGR